MNAEKILNSIQYVTQKSRYVSLNDQAIDNYVSHLPGKFKDNGHWSQAYPLGYRPRSRKEDEIDFLIF